MRVSAACNRYRRQCDLLWERQITTLDELLTYKENLQAEYNTLTAQRRALYCGKSRRACTRFGAEIYFSRRFTVQKPESCRCFLPYAFDWKLRYRNRKDWARLQILPDAAGIWNGKGCFPRDTSEPQWSAGNRWKSAARRGVQHICINRSESPVCTEF